ncbi:hypothetical protein [Corynebacterium caspium]|uniref:hypothetical protein n=1 Tax=Corynebacterium caspium TaxID=234828 RepID=UPI000362D4E3|nr:hypothetical protein [Corynebacterium caspium]WKD59917.1 hypothetical protein CCASP_07710 [Corynebacterium caspium DSM 44850]
MNGSQELPVFLGYPATTPAHAQVTAGIEVPPDFPREWLSFPDPDDPQRVYTVDLTWLESHWNCTFGTPACHGITPDRPDSGCCAHGAFLADEQDRERLYDAARQLPARFWQHRPASLDAALADPTAEGLGTVSIEPWLEWDELENEAGEMDPALKTAVVSGGCIFGNRDGWPTGAGCALHQWALSTGADITQVKPEVCWQVPVSRVDAWETRGDGVEILRTTIGEYDRRTWGDGGLDFPWWCTSDPGCHTAADPVWKTMAAELSALMSKPAYAQLVSLLEARAAGTSQPNPLQHPATAAANAAAANAAPANLPRH